MEFIAVPKRNKQKKTTKKALSWVFFFGQIIYTKDKEKRAQLWKGAPWGLVMEKGGSKAEGISFF